MFVSCFFKLFLRIAFENLKDTILMFSKNCFFFFKANNFLIQCSKLPLLRLVSLPSTCPTVLMSF